MSVVYLDSFDIYDNANASNVPAVVAANQASMMQRLIQAGGATCKTTNVGAPAGHSYLSMNTGDAVAITVPHLTAYNVGFRAQFNDLSKMGGIFCAWQAPLLNGTTLKQLFNAVLNTDGSISLVADSTNIATSSPGIVVINAFHYFEFVVSTAIVGGFVQTTAQGYLDGTLVVGGAASTGNAPSFLLQLDGSFNRFALSSPGVAAGGNMLARDLYISNSLSHNNARLGPVALGYLLPDGDVVKQWTNSAGSSAFALVNEIPADGDTTYITDSVVGHQDIFTFQDTSTPVVVAVQISTSGRRTDQGAKSFQSVVGATGGLEQSDPFYPGGNYAYWRDVLDIDPNTNAPWSVAGLNATDWGARINS